MLGLFSGDIAYEIRRERAHVKINLRADDSITPGQPCGKLYRYPQPAGHRIILGNLGPQMLQGKPGDRFKRVVVFAQGHKHRAEDRELPPLP